MRPARCSVVPAGDADGAQSGPAAAIRRLARDGADRIAEVALSANAGLAAEVSRTGTMLAAYASPKDKRPTGAGRAAAACQTSARRLTTGSAWHASGAASKPSSALSRVRPVAGLPLR